MVVKLTAGLYLLYLGYQMWRGAKLPLSFDGMQAGAKATDLRSFRAALTTQLSNPKAAVAYGSVFAALLPQRPPVWCYVMLPPAVFSIEAKFCRFRDCTRDFAHVRLCKYTH